VKIGQHSGRIARGFLFQYNVPDSHKVVSMISGLEKDRLKYRVAPIFHPTFNEYLDLRLDDSGPLGC
ncbi:MAG: hypothetical protein KBT59_13830, partial [Sphingomonadales bacterium]|nr:hypothetical protein [Sphingomonadales bacterium]